MFQHIAEITFAPVAAMLFFIVFVITDDSFSRKMRGMFLADAVLTLVLLFFDGVVCVCAALTVPTAARYFAAAVGYSLRPVVIFIAVLIIRRGETRFVSPLAIPAAVNAVFAFASCFWGEMYYYDAANTFIRGPLWWMPFAAAGFYLVVMLVLTVREFRTNGYSEIAIIFVIVGMCIFAVVLESLMIFRFVPDATMGIGIIFYYLFLHIQLYKRDALTNLLNRRSFFLDGKKFSDEPMLIVTIDMNGLKAINDSGGHAAGDRALKTLVRCISSCLSRGCRFYRTGGDEFAVIALSERPARVESMMSRAQEKLKAESLGFSWGVDTYRPGMEFADVLRRSDERMYAQKLRNKVGRE